MRISDWSSDVCSSDLRAGRTSVRLLPHRSAALLGKRRPAPNSHVHVLQTPAPFPCGCLRCSPCFTARCRTRPRIHALRQNGRASCRERVCQYVEISVVAVSLKKKKRNKDKETEATSKNKRK